MHIDRQSGYLRILWTQGAVSNHEWVLFPEAYNNSQYVFYNALYIIIANRTKTTRGHRK